MEDVGKDVEALPGEDPPNAKEAWRRMKGWYRASANRGPPPARATLERITAELVELYSQVPYLGDNIPVMPPHPSPHPPSSVSCPPSGLPNGSV